MGEQPLDKQTLESEYQLARPAYESLARCLTEALETILRDEGIDVLSVEHRVKQFDRFWEKIQRKGYEDPFEEVEDICGLRIVCHYKADLGRISEIIDREFDVKESIDQAALLKPGEFGYLSLHFIVTVKEDWLEAPPFRGLGGLKAEIQVRTILMHAWADISHKLAYKKKEHVPGQFQRELSRLSALFEIADERFDALRRDKEAYGTQAVAQAEENGRFDVSQEMNIDTLQALLDFYFPQRKKSDQHTSSLLDDLTEANVSLQEIVEAYESVKDILPSVEKELSNLSEWDDLMEWAQVGVVRASLDIASDHDWWHLHRASPRQRASLWFELMERWRSVVREGTSP